MTVVKSRFGLVRLLLSLLLSLAAACSQVFPKRGMEITAEVKDGSKFCTVVRIPAEWRSAPRESLPGMNGLYRKSKVDSVVLFSLSNPYVPEMAVEEKYGLDLEHRGSIRTASASEWEAGQPVDFSGGSVKKVELPESPEAIVKDERGNVTKDRRVLTVNGHVLAKSGDIWFGNDIAPGDRFAALNSINGWWDRGRAAFADSFFIDVYALDSGRRLALIRGSWRDFTPDGILNEIRWLSERDLVFPFGPDKRDILVCRFNP